MKKQEFAERYRAEMADVHVSPQLKRRTLNALAGKEKPVMKKKLSAVLAMTIALLLMGAAAVAAVSRAGIVDFAGYVDSYVPEDAQDYVQTDVLTMENDVVTVALRELYYDGYIARMTVDVTPKDPSAMLIAFDLGLDYPWQNMYHMERGWDENDRRTAVDVFREGNYQRMYAVSSWMKTPEEGTIGGTSNYNLSEDGVLTLYAQAEYGEMQAQRQAVLQVLLTPYTLPLTEQSQQDVNSQLEIKIPVALKQADYQNETYVSTEPAEYPGAGVRVDEIRLEVRPQEIHAMIDYTITDREAYNALEDGLWFEFIDPESTAEQPHDQRLKSGMSGGGSAGPVDGEERATAVHYRQTETLGRNELHETYTLRAYECWEKERFETHTFTMKKVEE